MSDRKIRRNFIVAICVAAASLGLVFWNANEGGTMPVRQDLCSEDSGSRISNMLRKLFSVEQDPEILSCSAGSTPWASFSYLSAEVTPGSFDGIDGFKPLNDPGWFPMDLMPDDYRGAFEGADWTAVNWTQSFDRSTGARIFLIKSPDNKAFVVVTSE